MYNMFAELLIYFYVVPMFFFQFNINFNQISMLIIYYVNVNNPNVNQFKMI